MKTLKHIQLFETFSNLTENNGKYPITDVIVLNKQYSIDFGERIIDFLENEYNIDINVIDYDNDELLIEIDGSPEDVNNCILYMDESGIMNTIKSDVNIQ